MAYTWQTRGGALHCDSPYGLNAQHLNDVNRLKQPFTEDVLASGQKESLESYLEVSCGSNGLGLLYSFKGALGMRFITMLEHAGVFARVRGCRA